MGTAGLVGTHLLAVGAGVVVGALVFRAIVARHQAPVRRLLQRHFGNANLDRLVVNGRKFHARIRADLQRAIDQFFASGVSVDWVCGIRQENPYFGINFSDLLTTSGSDVPVAVEYEDVDIGEDRPIRCAAKGLWLLTSGGRKYALLVSPIGLPGETPVIHMQLAAENGPEDAQFSDRLFAVMEKAVQEAASYRGKVLSLEAGSLYFGRATGVTVHKLRSVRREEVILPAKTLELLDRNVIRFVGHRESLAKVGQTTKKGLLFYGPPGNGKTHTIHYLAKALKGHTTLLITAEQVALLSEYMTLARLLEPSVVVIEDVDLIARERSQMDSACQESMLNRLLNEMDGLKEQAEILFVLTTNRPAELETALAARPGRVDQAIEFPSPDEECRARLARLYSGGIELAAEVLAAVVARTERTSAAFIKELMRRAVLHHLERSGEPLIELRDVDDALEELFVSGGSLNRALLGANAADRSC